MANHVLSTPTPRRQMLSASAALLMIGIAPSLASTAPNPDAELLAACAEYDEHDTLHRKLSLVIRGDDEAAADAAYEYCDKIAWQRVDALARVIIAAQAKTSAGVTAKAKVLICHLERYVPTGLDSAFEDEAEDHDLLAMSLARDVMAIAGGAS